MLLGLSSDQSLAARIRLDRSNSLPYKQKWFNKSKKHNISRTHKEVIAVHLPNSVGKVPKNRRESIWKQKLLFMCLLYIYRKTCQVVVSRAKQPQIQQAELRWQRAYDRVVWKR